MSFVRVSDLLVKNNKYHVNDNQHCEVCRHSCENTFTTNSMDGIDFFNHGRSYSRLAVSYSCASMKSMKSR